MARFHFSTKARTLRSLEGLLSHATVLPSCTINQGEWRTDPDLILDSITKLSGNLIVRSSAGSEDSSSSSMAGAFLSVAGVSATDREQLRGAIDSVFESYGKILGTDECFVQPELSAVLMSGVVCSRVPNTGAPYYVVNYDDETGTCNSVTSGRSAPLKTFFCFRLQFEGVESEFLQRLLRAVKELETGFDSDALDVEFAFGADDVLYLLQVRPIVFPSVTSAIRDEKFGEFLFRIESKLKKLNQPHPGVLGGRAVFSVMTDWNPAEMIGTRPRPLALSLYRELITDSVWAYQRNKYGYRDLRSFPLLFSFLGHPYIDVRASFNSFIPAILDDQLAGKLVDYYSEQLLLDPRKHDKVEFDIVFSCYHLDVTQKLNRLRSAGFKELEIDRIKYALLDLTNTVLKDRHELCRDDLARIKVLESRYVEVTSSELPIIDRLYWLLEDCKRYGTLPFAGLARAGFIAMQFLHSFVELGIFEDADFEAFMGSLDTVARQLVTAASKLKAGLLSRDEFTARFGHLRPGTYDITCPRYDEAFDRYFGNSLAENLEGEQQSYSLSEDQLERLRQALVANGIRTSPLELLEFIKLGIEGREYAKFVFTRNLSEILRLTASLGQRFDFDSEQMSFTTIGMLRDLYSNLTTHDLKTLFEQEILKNKGEYAVAQLVELPPVIVDPSQIYSFHLPEEQPNFITSAKTTRLVVLEEELPTIDPRGKIVFIRGADPGYDWLLSRGIAGLITMYGGANSHMAIRCAELNLPSVIGCGEKLFVHWSSATQLEIDCSARLVRIVS